MIRVISVVGARPQFVKAAVVSHAMRRHDSVAERILHTGQHYDQAMSDVFYRELDIPAPAFELGVGSAPHGAQTGRMLAAIEEVLVAERPDWVVVYGDTNSTLAGALAAAKLRLPLAHVEAGLRSFNREMPEEINRVLTDHCSDLLFAPTDLACANLLREGIAEGKIERVGDVMYDAALRYGDRAEKRSEILARERLEPGRYVLATVHRAENTDAPARLEAIFEALGRVGRDTEVIAPLHPRTAAALGRHPRGAELLGGIRAIEPIGYLDMLQLERHAALVVTDSGGVQKEAFFQRTPCVTVRDETEWEELVELGWNRLAPPKEGRAVEETIRKALVVAPDEAAADTASEIYGGGKAAESIVASLVARARG